MAERPAASRRRLVEGIDKPVFPVYRVGGGKVRTAAPPALSKLVAIFIK
jgi:hypothetical protein